MTETRSTISISWLGQSYVVLECEGKTIAIDPHDGASLNLPVYRVRADYLLITHDHFDHNAVEVVDVVPKNILKWKTGIYNINNKITIIGQKYPHDKFNGKIRGYTIAYTIKCGETTIMHLGDIGTPTVDLKEKPDILMLPVGGVYTIDAEEAWSIVERVSPKIVVPLHYWVPYSTVPLDPLDKFLEISKARRARIDRNTLKINVENLPEKTTIAVFPPPRTP